MVFTKQQIIQFIEDIIIIPRKNCIKWSKITNQSATLRIGYPGQHLASLVTGVQGEKSGARGNDLADGSEVKSCSRVDQLDKCEDCKANVLRSEEKCSNCNSTNIQRKDDSKWLFTIRSEHDLNILCNNTNLDRIIFIIDDYPNFETDDYKDIRIRVFEIYPKEQRHKKFKEIMTNYYYKIYLEHKKINSEKTPAPKNFWPYSYQFFLCNPIMIFEGIISDAYSENPKFSIIEWREPDTPRETINSILMPPEILTKDEYQLLYNKASRKEIIECLKNKEQYPMFEELLKQHNNLKKIQELFVGINERLREYLPLRETDKISTTKQIYARKVPLKIRKKAIKSILEARTFK